MTDTKTRVADAQDALDAARRWFDWADGVYADAAALAVTAAEERLRAEVARARAEREARR